MNINTDLHVALWASVSQAAHRLSPGLIFLVEAEVGRLQLHTCCLFVFITNGSSRVKGEVRIEFGLLYRSDLATALLPCTIEQCSVCYSTDVCVCLCVCGSTHICLWVVGGGSSIHERDILLSRHFPLCFHSDLVGDWWLNCGVHVNSNWWFMKILRVSEAAQAGEEEKDIAF